MMGMHAVALDDRDACSGCRYKRVLGVYCLLALLSVRCVHTQCLSVVAASEPSLPSSTLF